MTWLSVPGYQDALSRAGFLRSKVVGEMHEQRNLVIRARGCQRENEASQRFQRFGTPEKRAPRGTRPFREGQSWSGKRDSNPRPSAWKADALAAELFPLKSLPQLKMVEGGGFEPPKASPTDLQSVPFDRSGTPPRNSGDPSSRSAAGKQAGEGTRTPNHLITNEMLYQLSYASGAVSRGGTRPK
jgi:hypothetical protein